MPFLPSSGGSGSGTNLVSPNITQAAHGFVVGDTLYLAGTVYIKANASAPTTAEVVGVIALGGIVDANTFKLSYDGVVDLTGATYAPLVPGQVYYQHILAGKMSAIEPTAVSSVSKPLMIANSTTTGYLFNFRGTPASGQTAVVEYILVKNNVTTAAVATQGFFKPDTIVAGSIPYDAITGLFSLKAGKTYEMEADLAMGGGQSGTVYVWKDAGTGIQFGSQGVSVKDNGVSGAYNVMAKAIYTPSNDTTVGVVNLFTTAFPLLGAVDMTSVGTTGHSQPTMMIKQIGASPVPMDLVGEYVAPIYSTGNTTPTAVQNSSATSVQFIAIPIPSSGTWNIEWSIYAGIWQGNLGTVANGISSALYDNAGTLLVNSELSSGNFVVGGALASGANMQGTRSYTVTTTGATTFNVKVWNPASSNIATAFGSAAGRSYASARKISGLIPSSGQTVDFVNVRLSASIVGLANNSPVLFDVIESGNIPYSAGQFTLTAGKTYELRSNVVESSASNLLVAWFNITSGANISNAGAMNAAGGASNANQAVTIFTPTVTTVVSLRNVTSVVRDVAGGAVGVVASTASIVQLGSSSVIAGVYPGVWTSYTPIVTATSGGMNPVLPASAVITGSYSVQGKTMFLNLKYFAASVASGFDGTQSYQYSIPAGYVIDITKAAIPSVLTNTSGSGLDGGVIGSGYGRNSTASNSSGLIVMPLSTTTIGAFFEVATRLIGASSLAMTGASNTTISMVCQIPLL